MNEFLNELELEEYIKKMSSRKLQEFTARQVYSHEQRLTIVEKKSNRIVGVAAAIGTGIGAGIIAVISYLTGR